MVAAVQHFSVKETDDVLTLTIPTAQSALARLAITVMVLPAQPALALARLVTGRCNPARHIRTASALRLTSVL